MRAQHSTHLSNLQMVFNAIHRFNSGLRLLLVLFFGLFASPMNWLEAQETFIVELRNGLRLGPGTVEPIDTLSTNAMQRGSTGEVAAKLIDMLNDGLRKTYYNSSPKTVINVQPAPASERSTPIVFPAAAEVNKSGSLQSFAGILGISNFNRNGRRTLKFRLVDGSTMTVLQQITEVTPQYAKLEILRGADHRFVWDSREALSSIPSDQLNLVLQNVLDLSQPNEWLRLYSFYIEAKRFHDARQTIEEAIRRFPSQLGGRVNLIAQTEQLSANQQFEEINIRREAGQLKLAYSLLKNFPKDLVETQVRIKSELDGLSQSLDTIAKTIDSLKRQIAKLPDADQSLIQSATDELLGEVNIDTAIRLDDYIRLGTIDAASDESAVAMAVGGWLLGPGAGIQNFAVVKSLVRVRGLVHEYLASATPQRREDIVNELKAEEGAQPELLVKMLSLMKPPLEFTGPNDASFPDPYFRQTVNLPNGESVEYAIQLPPEYDPNRKYPCILALPGSIQDYESNIPIDFWCGSVMDLGETKARFGRATRYGYIVVSPNWIDPAQGVYQYTEAEHARVLACYRDALRRSSIDTDHVFITGHFEGATAAWDIAQSHPDLWAGAVLISPTADKYILFYHTNVQAPKESPQDIPLATYIVYGSMDGVRIDSVGVGTTADRYLRSNQYDSMVVEHIGKGRGLFSSELPRIFEWMELSSRQRLRTPRSLEFTTMRAGDRFFYWLEVPQVSPDNVSNAFELDGKRDFARAGRFEANLLDSAMNGIRVAKVPATERGAWIWLSPKMVDLGREIQVIFRGKTSKYNLSPDIAIMLEDVRQRGDRMHVFWQRIEFGRRD